MNEPINVNCILDKLQILFILQILLGWCTRFVQMFQVQLELRPAHGLLGEAEITHELLH
jgi:hypothetical protein